MLLTAVRLVPVKGIIELLRGVTNLDEDAKQKLVLLIAGDGEQREEIAQYVSQKQLNNVQLLGHLDESQLVRLLASADGFVLPSLRDPSPLAAIEASFAGLPLLLSINVGNHPELLVSGENGWLFDPCKTGEVREILCKFLNTPIDRLTRMGELSRRIAQEKFSTDRVVKRFVQEITQA